MDQPNLALVLGLAAGLAIVAYILWGPNYQPKKRKCAIPGLVNLGTTCFLNTLLQGLASCAYFVEWLDLQVSEEKPLTLALQQVLWVLNGRSETDTHSPELVLKVLRRHGWVLPSGEQDAHELFHCIVSTLQEENKKPAKTGSLSDVLVPSDTLSQTSDILEDPFESLEYDATLTPNEDNEVTRVPEDVSSRGESEQFFSVNSGGDSTGTVKFDSPRRIDSDTLRRGVWDRSGSSPPPCTNNEMPPFTGLLASSLTCCVCGHASSVRTDTFDSVSLTLGDMPLTNRHTLPELIRQFVRAEIVPEVHCEKCSANTSSIKTYNFGKLPPCLCFHIGRTAWHTESRTSSKRQDHVDFPEYLVMDPFTWKPKPGNSATPPSPQPISARHLYRLKSVVVHVGNVASGHFLTFRRGPISTTKRHEANGKIRYEDSTRWYMASDEKVVPTTMGEAMDSLAYMLFYEKCSADLKMSLLGESVVVEK